MSAVDRYIERSIIDAENLNLTQVCYYLNRSPKTIHNYVNKHGLPKHYGKGTGMNAYYVKSEVDEWVRKNPRFVFRKLK